jgi:hypothetical protein
MTGIGPRVIVIGRSTVMPMVMMKSALVVTASAELDIAGEGIGKMGVVMGVIDSVHQGDVALPRQH